MPFCRVLIIFKINFFEKFFQKCHLSVTVSNSLDPDQAQNFVRVQTVCKGYQQMTLVGNELSIESSSSWNGLFQPSLQEIICLICLI